jgi:mono/diheme cytochrome c family protein
MRHLLLAVPFVLAACGCSNPRTDTVMALTGEQVSGDAVYVENCESCHLEDGSGDFGPSLIFHVPKHPNRYLVGLILDGKGEMPSFDEDLSDQGIADVLVFLRLTFGEQE